MDELNTDSSNAGKGIIESTGILINTGSAVVFVTGPGAMIASGAGAVNVTGGGAVNTAGAGSVNATGLLAALGSAKYDSSSRSAAAVAAADADTFTFFGWTLARSPSSQVPAPAGKKMSAFVGLVVDVAVHVSHKKKRRRFGLHGVLKRIVSCTRGAIESASA